MQKRKSDFRYQKVETEETGFSEGKIRVGKPAIGAMTTVPRLLPIGDS